MGIARRRIGILAENDRSHLIERRRPQRCEHLIGRRADDGAVAPARVQPLGQRLRRAGEERKPRPAMLGSCDESGNRFAIGRGNRHGSWLFLGRHLQERIGELRREAAIERTGEQILVLQDLLQRADRLRLPALQLVIDVAHRLGAAIGQRFDEIFGSLAAVARAGLAVLMELGEIVIGIALAEPAGPLEQVLGAADVRALRRDPRHRRPRDR